VRQLFPEPQQGVSLAWGTLARDVLILARERQKLASWVAMLRLLILAGTFALVATGLFHSLAASLGLPGFGDHLAALVIAVVLTPLAIREMQ